MLDDSTNSVAAQRKSDHILMERQFLFWASDLWFTERYICPYHYPESWHRLVGPVAMSPSSALSDLQAGS
jgi:hypothetical protein